VSLDVEGTRRLGRLEGNRGAADVTLSADDLSAIRAAADQITVWGNAIRRHTADARPLTGRAAFPRPAEGRGRSFHWP
jgi:hypothetical protein